MSTTRRGTVLIVAGMVAALSAPIAVPDGTGHGMMAASVEVDGTAAGAAPLRPETYEVADEPVTATLQVLEPVEPVRVSLDEIGIRGVAAEGSLVEVYLDAGGDGRPDATEPVASYEVPEGGWAFEVVAPLRDRRQSVRGPGYGHSRNGDRVGASGDKSARDG